jgi:hypothetical protein
MPDEKLPPADPEDLATGLAFALKFEGRKRWHDADAFMADILKPVVARYQGKVSRIYFRADAGFANPEVYEYLEAEGIKYTIRLPANDVLQERIGHLLARPIGRPPNEVRRSYANFTHQAGTWTRPRRVVAKVEWHPGELYRA